MGQASSVPREALSLIARAASVPVFGLYNSFMGFGIVGGPLISFEHGGKRPPTSPSGSWRANSLSHPVC